MKYLKLTNRTDEEIFLCEENAYLTATQVSYIKQDAHRAYEKQARYQEEIFLRTKRRIVRLRTAVWNVSRQNWGWHGDDFVGVFERISRGAACFANFSIRHESISLVMDTHPAYSEEKRASQLYFLIDPEAQRAAPKRFKSIGDVKRYYGDHVNEVLKEVHDIGETVEKMLRLFLPSTYQEVVLADVIRMDRIVELMTQVNYNLDLNYAQRLAFEEVEHLLPFQYETGRLQRRAWAEKMQSKRMRHFFEDDFFEGWYQPIAHDLEHSLYNAILEIEREYWPRFQSYVQKGTAMKTGALLFFDDVTDAHEDNFREIITDMYNCLAGDVKKVASETLKDFKRLYRELQSSYTNLFKKELAEYLEKFKFGSEFVSENFAMVNVFLHQMHLERWSQDRTYGFWSLACDIGGALDLFLGASMLTIIEIVYLCYHYRICEKLFKRTTDSFQEW
ncbi:hypothetical protein Y032_0857g2720 [Ancylostoma ceylanicum]|uniref:Uncharacterized protein n=1 Tax=Ancylostoma ceylanicum TaxID=53326 RepID=A0A016WAA5_9BILA|nr:hypothetical protein Y032_0857g2720 [Ancylostoma ceylanicum]